MFKKRAAFGASTVEIEEEENIPEQDEAYRALRDEQAERIRRMLRGDDKEE